MIFVTHSNAQNSQVQGAGIPLSVQRLGYRLQGRSSKPEVSTVQTRSGVQLAPNGYRGSFPGVKWPGCEADHLHPSSVEVKNQWSYTPTSLLYAFMVWTATVLPFTTGFRFPLAIQADVRQGDTVNNTTRRFLIDIITNLDIKKLETRCFGLTLAIIRIHLEKLFCKSVIQLSKRAVVYIIV